MTRQSVRAFYFQYLFAHVGDTYGPRPWDLCHTNMLQASRYNTFTHRTLHTLAVYKQTHVCVCTATLIAWAAELSWGLEAPFESATVVDLKVKVPPGVVSSE